VGVVVGADAAGLVVGVVAAGGWVGRFAGRRMVVVGSGE